MPVLREDRQQCADRWFLSVAVNRPLVGELTPVTPLVCNSKQSPLSQLRAADDLFPEN